ncbi:hypothetical protein, partial [Aliivibrio fischeri]|uniref:hypothetical protein n=1 Tax=Aliivibrio fischeri TaxID=668 RepID=UPI001F1A4319
FQIRVLGVRISPPLPYLEKAYIERYEPFCYLIFKKRAVDSPTIRTRVLGVRISPPLPYLEKACIERYEPFCYLRFKKRAFLLSTT